MIMMVTVNFIDQYSARNANREASSHASKPYFFILYCMMSLYSKQNCNNNRDDE